MASKKRFATGGGFPYEGSPGRPIDFTLSYGKSDLLDPNSGQPAYTHRLEFSDPEASAYVCAMYGPPRDKVGLDAFARQLAEAYREVARDPVYEKLPVPPLKFGDPDGPERQAQADIEAERVARSCLWARQFGPGTKLNIDLAGADSKRYRARAIDRANRIVGEDSPWFNFDSANADSAEGGSVVDNKPVRYLGRRTAGTSEATAFDADGPAAPLVPSDDSLTPRQPAPLVGLVSGKPMSFHPVQPPIFGFPGKSAPDDEDWLLQLLAPRRGR